MHLWSLIKKTPGFIVSHRGIEIDPVKVKVIMEMLPPMDLKQFRGFLGSLQFVRRSISQHSERCLTFNKLLKKSATFIWDEECQKAFDEIKRYLLNPPGRPLILFITVTNHSLGVV